MNPSPSKVIVDAHVHLYPYYDLPRALDVLLSRLHAWVVPGTPDPHFMALIAERAGTPSLKELCSGPGLPSGGKWTLTEDHPGAAWIGHQASGASLTLIVGRQFATREKMEVLALGSPSKKLEGLPIRDIVESLCAEGQVPILPWSPGKWMFERKRIVRDLVEQWGPALALCDTAIRPRGIPAPAVFQRARQLNCRILAGSDPLPLPGEERGLGSYAMGLPDVNPSEDPVAILQEILKHPAQPVEILGRRNSAFQALARLLRYHIRK